MKKIKIFGMLAACLLTVVTTACSDNIDSELEPIKTDRTLTVTLDGKEIPDHTLDLGAAFSETQINVESNTRWTVEVSDCLGGWCDVDVINGSGNGSFTITVLENMKEKRDCYVTIYKTDAEGNKETDGSIQLKVDQAVSDVRLSPSSLPPFAHYGNNRQEFDIISNVAWTFEVTYEGENPTKFVTITPASDAMTYGPNDTFKGEGAATFFMGIQDNRTATDRKAYLNLHSAVADYSIEITQLKSEYTFDVSPLEKQMVMAQGGRIEFGVLSLSDWDVSSSADWITFTKESGVSSTSRITTTANVKPNINNGGRNAIIYFIPKDKNYHQLSVEVVQQSFDFTFYVGNRGDLGVLPESASSQYIELDSRFNWELTTPSWIKATPTSGDASLRSQAIGIDIDRNTTNNYRDGLITIVPLPTEFASGITLDPSSLGIGPISVGVTQFGGRKPVISTPWLVDGYGQTYATVGYNYYSPFHKVRTAGLQWRAAGTEEWHTVDAVISDQNEGTVTVDLTNLDAATHYEARGFVIDDTGETVYGSICLPFTTAGQRPGSGDNPTPSD